MIVSLIIRCSAKFAKLANVSVLTVRLLSYLRNTRRFVVFTDKDM